jgi:integrase
MLRHSYSNIRYFWAKMVQLAGLRYRKIHTLRHTYASLLLTAGEAPAYVQVQLGHSSLAVTLGVYGDFVPRAGHRGADRLDNHAQPNGPTFIKS